MRVEQASLTDEELEQLQKSTFAYFLRETNPENGMVPDSTKDNSAASITSIGFALTAYPIGVERKYLTRTEAIDRVLTTLRFFSNSEQSDAADTTGYKGFYYHFLDMQTGRRAANCELSTIDTTFLLAGALTAGMYFDRQTSGEREIRALAEALYAGPTGSGRAMAVAPSHTAGNPAKGFRSIGGRATARLLCCMCLGSDRRHILYRRRAIRRGRSRIGGRNFTASSFCMPARCSYINFRICGSIFAAFRILTCARGIDYFENSRRAAYAQQAYAIRNPKKFHRLWQIRLGHHRR